MHRSKLWKKWIKHWYNAKHWVKRWKGFKMFWLRFKGYWIKSIKVSFPLLLSYLLGHKKNFNHKNWENIWFLPFSWSNNSIKGIRWNFNVSYEFLISLCCKKMPEIMQCKWYMSSWKVSLWKQLQWRKL